MISSAFISCFLMPSVFRFLASDAYIHFIIDHIGMHINNIIFIHPVTAFTVNRMMFLFSTVSFLAHTAVTQDVLRLRKIFQAHCCARNPSFKLVSKPGIAVTLHL